MEELCELFREYGYQPLCRKKDLFDIDYSIPQKRIVMISDVEDWSESDNYFRELLRIDLQELDKNALILLFRHEDKHMVVLTTERDTDIFKGYISKCKITSQCDICVEDTEGADGYECSRCHNQLCLECYQSLPTNYCTRCIYCRYSIGEHIFKKQRRSDTERMYFLK